MQHQFVVRFLVSVSFDESVEVVAYQLRLACNYQPSVEVHTCLKNRRTLEELETQALWVLVLDVFQR